MEESKTRGTTTATIETRVIQPRLIIQALAFTAILYFCIGQKPPDATQATFSAMARNTSLSKTVETSILQYASQHSGLPPSALRIVQAQPQTWSDNCLGLADTRLFCTQTPVPGWYVAVMGGQKRWLYRTDASGKVIKLESNSVSPNQDS
jgi:hypothetical protein